MSTGKYSRLFKIIATVLLVAIALLTIVSWTVDNDLFIVALGCMALLVAIFPVCLRDSYDLFEPLSFVILYVMLSSFFASIYIYVGETTRVWSVSDHLFGGKSIEFLIEGGIVGVLGILCYSLGYITAGSKHVTLESLAIFRKREWSARNVYLVVFVLLSLHIYIVYLQSNPLSIDWTSILKISSKRHIIVGGIESMPGYLTWAANLLTYGFLFLVAYGLEKNRSIYSIWGLLTGIIFFQLVFFAFSRSSRGDIFILVLMIAIIWYYYKGYIKIKTIAMSGVILAVVSNIILSIREGRIPFLTDTVSMMSIIEGILGVSGRSMMTKMSYVLDALQNKIDYQYGKTFFLWVVSPIPRSIWESKPIISTGSILGPLVFRPSVGRSAIGHIGGVPPKFMVEVLWNFGITAIFPFMGFLGATMKIFYNSFVRVFVTSKNALLIYVVMLIPIRGLPTVSPAMIGLLRGLIPTIVIAIIVTRWGK